MLTYKRKLILTKTQQTRMDSWIGVCRLVYNLGLEVRIAAWRNLQKTIHKYELMKQITDIREIDWIADVPSDSLTNVMERLDRSYKKFFYGSGFPKWANKKKYNSITFKQTLSSSGNTITIPKMKVMRMFKDAPLVGEIRTITIKKEITGYFAYIVCNKVSKSIQNSDENQVIGLDMGIAHFFVDSNGDFVSNPQHFKKYQKQLRVEQRSLSRKKKGSNSWKKQCKKVALLHHKIGNVRKDFLHKESTKLAKQFHTCCRDGYYNKF